MLFKDSSDSSLLFLLSKILSEDFVTPSGNPLAQTQQHTNNDKFHEKVIGNQSNINEMALETKLKRRYSGIQKKILLL